MNLTYYSKKCKFNLCTPFEVIVNISKFRKETKQRIFQLQQLMGRKAEDRYTTVGFKEIIEDCANAEDDLDLIDLDRIYKWRKKWWLHVVDIL